MTELRQTGQIARIACIACCMLVLVSSAATAQNYTISGITSVPAANGTYGYVGDNAPNGGHLYIRTSGTQSYYLWSTTYWALTTGFTEGATYIDINFTSPVPSTPPAGDWSYGSSVTSNNAAIPSVTHASPATGDTLTNAAFNLYLYFSWQVFPQSSTYLTIYRASGTIFEQVQLSTGVSYGTALFSPRYMMVDPTTPWENGTYYIKIDSAGFKDAYGNAYTGISDSTAWTFTVADPPPSVQSLVPANGDTLSSVLTTPSVAFSETPIPQSGTYLRIVSLSGDSTFAQLSLTSGSVTLNAQTLTIHPPVPFANGTYAILVDSGGVKDANGRAFAGILDSTTWTFVVNDPPPHVQSFTPADGTTSDDSTMTLSMVFSESVVGSATKKVHIWLMPEDSLYEEFMTTDPRVSISDSIVTIVPTGAFMAHAYAVTVDSGAFTDPGGFVFSGVSSKSDWNMTVLSPAEPNPGTAISIDSTEHVNVPFSAILNPAQNFAVEFWARVEGGQGTYRCPIASEHDSAGTNRGYYFYASDVNDWQVWLGEGSNWTVLTGVSVVLNRWYHISLTYDSVTARLYVDGTLASSASLTFLANEARPFRIGDLASNAGVYPFKGSIDEIRVWNVVRTQQQIRESMHRTVSSAEQGLAAYFQINEGSGTQTNDVVGGHVGTFSGNPSWVTSTVPAGSGTSTTANGFSSGTATLSTLSLTTTDVFDGSVDLTSTQIDLPAYALPGQSALELADRYWVVNAFGTPGAFSTSLTFTVPSSFTSGGSSILSGYRLYRRESAADGSWETAADSATSATSTSVTFGNIASLGQYVVGYSPYASDSAAGRAMSFTGGNGYVDLPYSSLINPSTNFTIEFWARPEGSGGVYRCPVGNEDGANHTGYYFYANPDNNWQCVLGTGSTWALITGSAATTGQWHHLAMTYGSGTLKFYVNGTLAGSTSTAFALNPSLPLRIGDLAEQVGTYPWNGQIDEVRLWNSARTQDEIRQDMHRTESTLSSDLIVYMQFNEASGSTTADVKGGRTATLNGSPARVLSTVPVGAGTSSSASGFTSGSTSLGTVALTTTDAFDNAVDVVATALAVPPDSLPVGSSTVLADRYWIVSAFGTPGSFAGYLTFTVPSSFTSGGPVAPWGYRLYRRDATADGTWQLAATATSATSTSVTFGNVTSFGQFALGHSPTPFDTVSGKALSFDGVDDYVTVPDDATLDITNSITLEAWVKLDTTGHLWIVGKDPYNTAYQLFADTYFGNHFTFQINADAKVEAGTPEVGVWTHVAGTYDGAMLRMYVNGELIGTQSYTTAITTTSGPLKIGAFDYLGNPWYPFHGSIDEVRVWNVARTQAQIRANMHITVPPSSSGLVVYLQCNDTSGSTLVDVAGGRTGSLVGAPLSVTSTVPVGGGAAADTSGFIGGSTSLGTISLTTTDAFDNAVDLVATALSVPPDSLPGGSSTLLNDRYWVVNAFGTPGTFAVNVTFTVPAAFTNNGAASPGAYTLYHRSGNAVGPWNPLITGAATVTSTGVTFDSVTSFSQFMIGTNDPLPVEMVGMRAEVRGQMSEVRLSWTTASEVDNAGWEVERRSVSRQSTVDSPSASLGTSRQTEANGWVKLGFVEGAGTSSSPHAYVFTDDISQSTIRNPHSRFAYRLKQLDRSGSFSYSHEVEVEVGTAPKEFTLGQNYPNPFNPTTTIAFTLPTDGLVTLKVFDLLGREVRTLVQEVMKSGYQHRVVFDASGLPSGMYVVRLQSGDRQLLRKMSLLK